MWMLLLLLPLPASGPSAAVSPRTGKLQRRKSNRNDDAAAAPLLILKLGQCGVLNIAPQRLSSNGTQLDTDDVNATDAKPRHDVVDGVAATIVLPTSRCRQ